MSFEVNIYTYSIYFLTNVQGLFTDSIFDIFNIELIAFLKLRVQIWYLLKCWWIFSHEHIFMFYVENSELLEYYFNYMRRNNQKNNYLKSLNIYILTYNAWIIIGFDLQILFSLLIYNLLKYYNLIYN